MMLKIIKNQQIQEKIAILSMIIFALHSLFFIFTYSVNLPMTDEWHFVSFAKMVLNGEPFWEFEKFLIYNGHLLLFPNLVLAVNIFLFSWNFSYLMIFGWFLVCISSLLLFLILRKTYPKMILLIAPISAILFSPLQYENFLWAAPSVQLYFISFSMILSIYCLTRINSNRFFIIPAIVSGIISSFSGISGLVIWIVGFYSILLQNQWKKSSLLIWSIATTMVLLFYYVLFSQNIIFKNEFSDELVSISGIKFFIFYLAHGLALKYDLIRWSTGSIIFVSIIGFAIYVLIQRKIGLNLTPWIQLGLAGILSGGLTLIGRFSFSASFPSRYAAFTVWDQVATLVIITVLTYYIYNKINSDKKRKLILTIYSMGVIAFIILLISAYFFGYRDGEIWKNMNDEFLECLINPVYDFKCIHPNNVSNLHNTVYTNAPILYDLNLYPYHNIELKNSAVPLLLDSSWNKMNGNLKSHGEIEHIQIDKWTEIYQDSTKFEFTDVEELLLIYGWANFLNSEKSVESIYVFVDDEVHSKGMHGFLRKDLDTFGLGTRSLSGWYGIIDPNEISYGCHSVSVRITHDNMFSEIYLEKQLCKNFPPS
jgi:hypothetical protein